MDTGHIRPLTSLRGIAAIYVFFHHLIVFFLRPVGEEVGAYTALLANGYLWVDFFFILSGFLLALLYGALIREKALSKKDFLIRRFARIYPLHLVVLLLFVMVQLAVYLKGTTDAFSGQFSLTDLWRSLFLVHAIQLHPTYTPWNGPSWSISAEWCAYILFPLFVWLVYRLREGIRQIVFWVCGFTVLAVVENATSRQLDLTGYLGLIRCFVEFSMGIMLYATAYHSPLMLKWLATSKSQLLLMLALLVSLHFERADLTSVALMVLIVASVSRQETAVTRALSHPWLFFLGTISYSIYMVHWLVFSLVDKAARLAMGIEVRDIDSGLPLLAVILVCSGLVLITSVLSFRLVEEPLRKWLPRVLGATDKQRDWKGNEQQNRSA